MTLTAVEYPIAPTLERRKGSLLDAATVSDSGFAWQDGVGLFDSYNCLNFGSTPTFCGANTKDLDQQPAWQDGVRFGGYGGVTCRAVGLDTARMKSAVRDAFEAGESTAVEAGLMVHRFAENTDVDALPGEWAAPVDITPAGGAVRHDLGVALLEGHAGRNYAGAPTLHVPIVVASMLLAKDGAKFDGDVLRTKMGSKIAAGAGYDYPNLGPTGIAAADGEKWLYATGEVQVIRSELILRDAIAMQANDVSVLAERGYIVTVDCYAAAIRVDLDA